MVIHVWVGIGTYHNYRRVICHACLTAKPTPQDACMHASFPTLQSRECGYRDFCTLPLGDDPKPTRRIPISIELLTDWLSGMHPTVGKEKSMPSA
jgi:hypothetical protein